MTVDKQLLKEFKNDLEDAQDKAGTGVPALFSTAYDRLVKIMDLATDSDNLCWMAASGEKYDIDVVNKKVGTCYFGMASVLKNVLNKELSLSDETVSRFNDLLYYFKAPSGASFNAVRNNKDIPVKDMIPQGTSKRISVPSKNRVRLLAIGHKAISLDITGNDLATGYTPDELETLIREASVRGIPMEKIKSFHGVRRNCTVQQLIAAAENFDSTAELRDFAKGIPVSPKTKNFWDVLLNSKMGVV